LFSVALCCYVSAQPLIYNTNQVFQSTVFYGVTISNWVAAPFLTGPSAATLNSVTFYEFTFGNPTGSLNVSIYGDNNGTPGSTLSGGGLSGPATPHGSSFLTYTAGAPLTLAPNTPYWVVASSDTPSTGPNVYGWLQAPSSSFVSSVGWSYTTSFRASFDFTHDQGSNWFHGAGSLFLAVDGALVPEPSAFVFLCLACAVALRRLANESATSRSDPTSGRASV